MYTDIHIYIRNNIIYNYIFCMHFSSRDTYKSADLYMDLPETATFQVPNLWNKAAGRSALAILRPRRVWDSKWDMEVLAANGRAYIGTNNCELQYGAVRPVYIGFTCLLHRDPIKLICNSTGEISPWHHLAAFESWLVDPCPTVGRSAELAVACSCSHVQATQA